MEPELNDKVIEQIQKRIGELDSLIKDPNVSAEAKADAAATKASLKQELALRQRFRDAQTDASRKKAENDLAGYRKKTCPLASDGSTVETCKLPVLYVHLHMRFLLPKQLLEDMRDASKYPRRSQNVPEKTFSTMYSFEGMAIPAKKRWGGDHPVVGATVKLGGQTVKTDKHGTARFEDLACATYTIEIEPPSEQSTTLPAGPELPVRSGYHHSAAPPYMYRPFRVAVATEGTGRWSTTPEAKVLLPHLGDGAAYAGVAGVCGPDLYLDWKPDWLKIQNRHLLSGRTNEAIVLHATATTLHEQIGSPINTFNGGAGTAAHYLVDLDGHIVKLVHEEDVAYHASNSHWHELDGLNFSGIGIETVHTDDNSSDPVHEYREFTREQYAALNRLITKLRTAFDINESYICGHNDCRDGARDCPGDMFDWKSLEDAGNALKVGADASFKGDRVVYPAAQTAPDAAVPISKRLYDIGYTGKTVQTALERFVVRAWSGSRFEQRPHTSLEKAVPAQKPEKVKQVTQEVADAVEQMFQDL